MINVLKAEKVCQELGKCVEVCKKLKKIVLNAVKVFFFLYPCCCCESVLKAGNSVRSYDIMNHHHLGLLLAEECALISLLLFAHPRPELGLGAHEPDFGIVHKWRHVLRSKRGIQIGENASFGVYFKGQGLNQDTFTRRRYNAELIDNDFCTKL